MSSGSGESSKVCELALDSLAFGGDAVGRSEGKVVFVPFGAPGDRARVRITSEHRSYDRGVIAELVCPGPGRRETFCELFGTCGGCQWQHLEYSVQVEHKSAIFSRAMREAKVEEIRPLIAAPRELGYRRRVRLHWERRADAVGLGFYRRGSRSLLDAADCPLLVAPLGQSVQICREALRCLPTARGNLLAIADPWRDEVHVSLRLDRASGSSASGRDWIDALVKSLHRPPIVGGQIIDERFGSGTIQLWPPEDPGKLEGSAAAFIQANGEQDRALRQLVTRWIDAERGARVLELFAGVGNLTTCLAAAASEVTAVESSRPGAALLRHNCRGIEKRVRVVEADALDALQMLRRKGAGFDLALLNPPRSGCPEVAGELSALGVRRALYISCDPMTLARDLRILRRHGLAPRSATPIDMMPQTFHVEGVVATSDEP